jgi:hypothetical protein
VIRDQTERRAATAGRLCRAAGASVAGAALAAAALSAVAGADGAPTLGARGVAGIARHAAQQWGERHPHSLEFVTASLGAAKDVVGGNAPAQPAPPDPAASQGAASSEVDVIAVWGHFTANASPPRGAKAPTGTVLELIVDAHTGAIETRALYHRVPVPLSRLGTVRRLELGGAPRHPGARHQ